MHIAIAQSVIFIIFILYINSYRQKCVIYNIAQADHYIAHTKCALILIHDPYLKKE